MNNTMRRLTRRQRARSLPLLLLWGCTQPTLGRDAPAGGQRPALDAAVQDHLPPPDANTAETKSRRLRRPYHEFGGQRSLGLSEVTGTLDKDLIRVFIRRHRSEVDLCFEQVRARNPDQQSGVSVRFTISQTGAVARSKVHDSTIGNAAVEECIVAAVRRWKFPLPKRGVVIATFPFYLRTRDDSDPQEE